MNLNPEEIMDLKKRVAIANKTVGYWYQQMGTDVFSMTLGHVSARIPGTETCLIKGRPPALDLMSATDETYIVTIDVNTNRKVDGEPNVRSVGEIELHTAVYKARPDVKAIAHGHSNFVILASLLGLNLVPLSNTGLDMFDEPIPIFPNNALINTPELGDAMAEALGKAKVILLRNHGSVVVSEEGPEDAVSNLINLEVQAKLNFYAFSAVGKDYVKLRVPEDQRIAYLTRLRKVLKDRSLIEIQCEYNARMAKF